MDKIINSIIGKPIVLAITSIILVGIGFLIQVALPYDQYRAHGAGPFLTPPDPLVLKGQEVYMQAGCQYCHSQNLRPLAWEVRRFVGDKKEAQKYGYYAGADALEYSYATPSMRGSFRIGPDLSRLAHKYDDPETLQVYLSSKKDTSLKYAYHQYGSLFQEAQEFTEWDGVFLAWKIKAMMQAGIPFSDNYHKSVFDRIVGKTKGEALGAYLMSLGERRLNYNGQYYK